MNLSQIYHSQAVANMRFLSEKKPRTLIQTPSLSHDVLLI